MGCTCEGEAKRKLEAVEHDLQVTIHTTVPSPRDGPLKGFDIAMEPARERYRRRCFDWKAQGDGKLVVSLADVTGHGIGPTAAPPSPTPMREPALRLQPHCGFRHIGQALHKPRDGRFVTFVAAVCGPDSGSADPLANHGEIFFTLAKGSIRRNEHKDFPAFFRTGQTLSTTRRLTSGVLLPMVSLNGKRREFEQFGVRRWKR
jgi:hypothetical protein